MNEETLSCSGCGRTYTDEQFPFGLSYCPGCGQRLIRPEPRETLAFCPYCGQKNAGSNADFCVSCGKKFIGNPSVDISFGDISNVKKGNAVIEQPALASPLEPLGEPDQVGMEEPMDFSGYGVGYAPYYRRKPGILDKTASWIGSVVKRGMAVVGDYISGRYRVKKLYDYWTSYSDLPPEALPSSETIEQLTRESGADTARPLRISLVILAFTGIVIVFVGVGMLIRSC